MISKVPLDFEILVRTLGYAGTWQGGAVHSERSGWGR